MEHSTTTTTTTTTTEEKSVGKLESSHYKGVVPQPNGRWGAQIYEKHLRVWIGTFRDEAEAAKAYDVAAQRFRGPDAVTNFRPLSESEAPAAASELAFLHSRSKSEIIDMLRKHTYHDELQQSLRASCGSTTTTTKLGPVASSRATGSTERDQLFDKALTPSDVGKLNRLVVPKQQAEKHFPLHCKGMLLSFEDGGGKLWRFRYSYWNSSQSYVLTKGWSRFVKEAGLRAGDVVSFQRSTGPEKQLYIRRKPRGVVLPLLGSVPHVFRLFGVDIVEFQRDCSDRKKRMREIHEVFAPVLPPFCKRQCLEGL